MHACRHPAFAILAACLMSFAWLSAAAGAREGAVNDRLASCDAGIVRAAADEVFRDPRTLKEPLTLYQAAMGLAVAGQHEQAGVAYLAAHLRTSRQILFEKGDRPQLLAVMEMTISPLVMPTLWADPELARTLVRRVIDWDRSTPDPFRDSAAAKSAEIQPKIAAIDAALARLPDQIRDDPARAAKARAMDDEARRQIAAIRAQRCGTGALGQAPSTVTTTRRR